MGCMILLYTNIRGGGRNSSILEYVNGDVAGAIAAVFLAFLIYIVIRVVISSQKEKDEEISRRKRIAELTKRHLKFKKK